MLEQGLIGSSTSAWASRFVLVKIEDGNWRFCIDYTKLNDVTQKDFYAPATFERSMDSVSWPAPRNSPGQH